MMSHYIILYYFMLLLYAIIFYAPRYFENISRRDSRRRRSTKHGKHTCGDASRFIDSYSVLEVRVLRAIRRMAYIIKSIALRSSEAREFWAFLRHASERKIGHARN